MYGQCCFSGNLKLGLEKFGWDWQNMLIVKRTYKKKTGRLQIQRRMTVYLTQKLNTCDYIPEGFIFAVLINGVSRNYGVNSKVQTFP